MVGAGEYAGKEFNPYLKGGNFDVTVFVSYAQGVLGLCTLKTSIKSMVVEIFWNFGSEGCRFKSCRMHHYGLACHDALDMGIQFEFFL
jgi:hypothetical protein